MTADAYNLYAEALAAGESKIGQRARAARELDDNAKLAEARLAAPGSMRATALWYAKQGIPVFPVMPGEKRPATQHGFKDATTDLEFVGAIWAAEDYNIATPTGLAFDVVDVDGAEGVQALMYGQQEWRKGLLGHVLTPRPHGHHLYFRASGAGNATAVMPGVDLRGAGGYVLLPPSISTEHSRRYRWIKPLELTK